jgi:Tfp pilus assembly protein PilZ
MLGMSFALEYLRATGDDTTVAIQPKGRTTMAAAAGARSEEQGFGEARFSDRRSRPVRAVTERRAVPRYAVELAVTVNSEHNFYEGLLRDMGVAGVFVATHRAHAIGEWIEINIQLPDGGSPLRAIGEVRWTREYAGEGAPEPGMGILFRTISPEDVGRIATFLSRREPLMYEE